MLGFVMGIEEAVFDKVEEALDHRCNRFGGHANQFAVNILRYFDPVPAPVFGGDEMRHAQHGLGDARHETRNRIAQKCDHWPIEVVEMNPLRAFQPHFRFSRRIL